MRNRKVTAVGASVALVASLIFSGWSLLSLPPRTQASLPDATGRAMAREVLKLVGPQGRVTVVTRDTEAFKQPASDFQRRSFEKELERAKVPIAATQRLQLDPLRPVQVPPGDFFELIRRAPVGDVIVSFMGPPLLSAEQRAALGVIKPRIVAFCPGNQAEYLNLRFLFEQKLLHAAVIGRVGKTRTAVPSSAQAESFESQYAVVTSADLSALPPASGPTP